MSNLGRPLRMLWYELNNYTGEELNGKTLLKFMYGSLLESLVLVLAEASGHVVERLQEEVVVDGIKGHIDAVIDGVLVDVKSASTYGFKKFKEGSLLNPGQDSFGYIAQAAGYAHALNLPAAWVAIEKQSGELCTLHLPKELIDSYDVRGRIADVKKAMSNGLPEKCYSDEPDGESGNLKLSIGCSYCAYKYECHKDANEGKGLRVFSYSRSPVFLTKVVKTPKVFELTNNNNNKEI